MPTYVRDGRWVTTDKEYLKGLNLDEFVEEIVSTMSIGGSSNIDGGNSSSVYGGDLVKIDGGDSN